MAANWRATCRHATVRCITIVRERIGMPSLINLPRLPDANLNHQAQRTSFVRHKYPSIVLASTSGGRKGTNRSAANRTPLIISEARHKGNDRRDISCRVVTPITPLPLLHDCATATCSLAWHHSPHKQCSHFPRSHTGSRLHAYHAALPSKSPTPPRDDRLDLPERCKITHAKDGVYSHQD